MNWRHLRRAPWLDTRARFVADAPLNGALLDLGSSDGETLCHIAELRPDLKLHSVDIEGAPERFPKGCDFSRANLETDTLRWPDGSIDRITCMHLVEHLNSMEHLLGEMARLLKPGGSVYIETPHPKAVALPSPKGKAAGTFTLNFYDDPTHIRPVAVGGLAHAATQFGLQAVESGISRNLLFAAAWPILFFFPPSRKTFTSRVHWIGWSAYIILRKRET